MFLSNRVLLRVRMLYYIKHEVLGDLVTQIQEGANARYLAPPRAVSFTFSKLFFANRYFNLNQSIHSFIIVKRCIFTPLLPPCSNCI